VDAAPRIRLGILTSHPIQYQACLFRELARRVDLHVYFAHKAGPQEQAEAGFGVGFEWDVDLTSGFEHSFLDNLARAPSVVRFSGCDTPDIAAHLRSGRHDALLVYGWHLKSYLQGLAAGKRLGIPVLARGDSHLHTPRSAWKQAVKRLAYPLFLRSYDGFVVVGRRARDYLLHYGVPEGRIRIAPHCIDVAWFERGSRLLPQERRQLRQAWDVAEGETVVLFVGKLIECKRPLDLVFAVQELRRRSLRVRAVFVGSGPLENAIRETARRHDVPVTLTGFKNQSELPRCYAAADIAVLPSESETWGLVVNEALACGVPVVISDRVGCAEELAGMARAGLVYPVGDIGALADAMTAVTSSAACDGVRSEIRRLGAELSPARSAEAIAGAVRDLLAMRGSAENPVGWGKR
jgi:glycosyltransferase involved in cell wall biosynthesis